MPLTLVWLRRSGLATSPERTMWPADFGPELCGSIATMCSTQRLLLGDLSNRASAANWANVASTHT